MISSAQTLEPLTTLAQNLAMIFLDPNLALPVEPTLSRVSLKRTTLTMGTLNHLFLTTTRAGQLLEASLASPLELSLPNLLEISQPKAMGTSHLKSSPRPLQALQPALSLTQDLLNPVFLPALAIFLLLLPGWTTLLSTPTSPLVLCSLPNHPLKPLQAIFLACQTFPLALKDCLKDPCSCPRDLSLPRLKAQEDQLLSLGTQ